MKKIITAEQIRAADRHSIQHEPISSIDLMERASLAFVDIFTKSYDKDIVVNVVAGTGNNGGDGLAVARILSDKGYTVNAQLIRFSKQLSPDCQTNLDRLNADLLREVFEIEQFTSPQSGVIIDALFGSGLNRPVSDFPGGVVERINQSAIPVVSIDIPSGLFSDDISLDGAVVKAEKTITFQRPKLSFMLPETGRYVNDWEVVDIRLDEQLIQSQKSSFHYQALEDIQKLIPKREKFQHKGHFGRVQVFSGSLGKMGAAFLCAKAVLRTGTGLLTVHIPSAGNDILQTALPEAMVTLDKEHELISSGELLPDTDAICIGPGIGQDLKTAQWLSFFLKEVDCPLVLDADALNLISKMERGYENIPSGTVITPHVGEFDRLFGAHENSLARIETMLSVAKSKSIVIILKGAHTAIALPSGELVFNTTGNVGMATAGSGDVLSGVITSLLGQGMNPEDAARLGVFIHGKAGDLAETNFGKMSLMASDLLNELPNAIINVSLTTFI